MVGPINSNKMGNLTARFPKASWGWNMMDSTTRHLQDTHRIHGAGIFTYKTALKITQFCR